MDQFSKERKSKREDKERLNKLFIANLTFKTTDEEKEIGFCYKTYLVKDNTSGNNRGFGFALFKTKEQTDDALKLNGKSFNGRKIRISLAQEKGFKFDNKVNTAYNNDHLQVVVRGLNSKIPLVEMEKSINKMFSKYGKLENIRIPANKKNKKYHSGYAFLTYKNVELVEKVINENNGQILRGREISCDKKLPRGDYLNLRSKFFKELENEFEKESKQDLYTDKSQIKDKEQKKDDKINKIIQELDNKIDQTKDNEFYHSEGSEESEDDEEFAKKINNNYNEQNKESESESEENSEDENESKDQKKDTESKEEELKRIIYINNISYETDESDLTILFRKYGPTKFVVLVRDKQTGNSKGSGFVKYKYESSVIKLFNEIKNQKRLIQLQKLENTIDDQKDVKNQKKDKINEKFEKEYESHLELDGRKLYIYKAVDKQNAEDLKKSNKIKLEKIKDKRNLYLLEEGYLSKNSEESKVLPKLFFKKMQFNYQMKKDKLKNINFHVSKYRLSVQNLNKKTEEKDLRNLFFTISKEFGKEYGMPRIIQVKIIKDTLKGESKGFGFVQFEKHEHALISLRKIANNIELDGNLLMVEFAIDDTLKLQRLTKSMKMGKLKPAKKNSNNEENVEKSKKSKKRRRKNVKFSEKNVQRKKSKKN